MAQAGYTPLQLYYSTTVAATPSAGNLNSGELAINITDGKLFYKDNSGVVQVVATKAAGTVPGAGIAYSTGSAWGSSYTTSGSGTTLALTTSPVFVTPTLGAATATSINNVSINSVGTAATLAISNNKVFTVQRTLTLTGTDATTMTFPGTSATIARTDAGQTFTGTQTFSSDAAINGLTIGLGAGAIASNTALGNNALLSNTTGSNNTAVGTNALVSNTTGVINTAVGPYALAANTIGNINIAVGNSLLSNTSGSFNIAVGTGALSFSSTSNNNIAVGYNALYANTTGNSNVAVGVNAGDVITTGSRNTIIGDSSDPSAAGGNDQTVVGQGLTGKGNDTAFIGGTNGAYNEKNVTTWETTSDARLKKNIVDNHDGLAKIKAIRVRNFEYLTVDEITELPKAAAVNKAGTQLGVIAQEMLPECISTTSEGVLSVNTDPLIWYLINAVKQLSAEVAALKAK
jgi:hypothetical protein